MSFKRIAILVSVLLLCYPVFSQSFIGKALLSVDNYVNNTKIGRAGPHFKSETYSFASFDLSSIPVCGEYRYMAEDEEFIKYLIGNSLSHDAVYYLYGNRFEKSDTLSFYKGLSLYTSGALAQASSEFSSIDNSSVYFEPSVFYGAVCDAYSGDFDRAVNRLLSYDGGIIELKNYELAAFSLLKEDWKKYEEYSKGFSYSSYALGDGEKVFDGIYRNRTESKEKSPFLSAVLSTVVPGLGKLYSGVPGQGVASFLLVGSFGAFAAENWIKNGAGDWRTILFTTIASILHISNIYGSYVSVELYNNNLKNAQNQTIIFNIHVPVRSFFK